MKPGFSIGAVARHTGVKVPTIRFYEQIGLVPPPRRSEHNRRYYGDLDVQRLLFIRHARELGFEVAAIRSLLALQDHPQMPCGQIDALVAKHLAVIGSKIRQLTDLRHELQRILASCTGGCVADCRVIESIATCEIQ
jgi:DNA-binding transcriptional MerR regulator